jgi:hypothetical protein
MVPDLLQAACTGDRHNAFPAAVSLGLNAVRVVVRSAATEAGNAASVSLVPPGAWPENGRGKGKEQVRKRGFFPRR